MMRIDTPFCTYQYPESPVPMTILLLPIKKKLWVVSLREDLEPTKLEPKAQELKSAQVSIRIFQEAYASSMGVYTS